jgi:hypothetical protein
VSSGQDDRLDDDELVAGPNEFQDGGDLVPVVTTLTADLFGADDVASGGAEARLLGGVVLIEGRDAGVTDFGHRRQSL